VKYLVRRGDSLTSIARRFRVPVSAIVTANHLANADHLVAGDTLRIPLGQTFSLVVSPTTGPAGERFAFALTHATPSENIIFTIRSPKATYAGPPHQASSDGTVSATYQTAPNDPVGTYTVTARGDQGTDASATFVVTAAAPPTS
jgi:spore germination protein YaaH